MRQALIAGNWKMYGSLSFVSEFAERFVGLTNGLDDRCQVLLLPPVPYLAELGRLFADSAVEVGAQDLHPEVEGAFTGEVAAEMIRDLGGRWVLVGHSERRQLFAEDDGLVAQKFAAALRAGLRPILCVGETLEQREAGQAEGVVRGQLQAVMGEVGVAGFASATLAYEPVWAIGTGHTATPAQAQAMHGEMREFLASWDARLSAETRILYGGSVKPENAAALLAEPDIDGGLVGGASLDPEGFAAIVAAAQP